MDVMYRIITITSTAFSINAELPDLSSRERLTYVASTRLKYGSQQTTNIAAINAKTKTHFWSLMFFRCNLDDFLLIDGRFLLTITLNMAVNA